jgi:8-oxo-dGTP diphosphatase
VPYTYAYPRPAMTADVVAFTEIDGKLHVLLIQRGRDPFAGSWAFPGGFVEENEPLAAAARRELLEETGFSPDGALPLVALGAYGDPGRDPRGHTVSAVFLLWVPAEARAAVAGTDDATDARFLAVTTELPATLAFDHAKILADALQRARLLLAADPATLLGSDRASDRAAISKLFA